MTADKEYQESYAIALRIAEKIHKIADKKGIAPDEATAMVIGFAFGQEDGKYEAQNP